MFTHAEIVEILNREVSSADARLKDARQIVDALISEAPGALPQPDGQHRITIAIKRQIMAREGVKVAVRRNCDFMLNGIVPEDLKKPMSAASQSQPVQTRKLPLAS
jgi:hypothetical protein